MIGFIFFGVLLLSFYRDILFAIFYWVLKPENAPPGPWDLHVRAQMRLAPRIYLTDHLLIETLSIRTLWGSFAFVHRDLWSLWNDEERGCFLAWVASANLKSSTAERVLFGPKFRSLDRDICLVSAHPLSFSSLLKTTIDFRNSHSPTTLGSWFSGLSFLGPSFFGDWPTHDERLRVIASYLAELSKSQ